MSWTGRKLDNGVLAMRAGTRTMLIAVALAIATPRAPEARSHNPAIHIKLPM